MSTTDILDLVKKVKSEMPAGAFSPVEEKSLVYDQQQGSETFDYSSLTPAARDVLRLAGKIKQGTEGISSGFAKNTGDSQQQPKYDSREQAIIDRNLASFADDKLAGEAAGDMEVQQRRQQRAYAEQAPPEVVAPVKELLSSSGDRAKVLDIVRKMTPEQKEESLRLAAGIAQQMGDDRGGAIGRTLGALSLGVSKGVSQPIMELIGMGGTQEEIDYIRKLDAIAGQEFAPARPGDPWYESGPLQAAQMAPWMATVVGGNVAGTAAGKIGGQLLARGAAAGVPGAKAAFQAAGAVGRAPTLLGRQAMTTRGVLEGAGGLAGITAASFPGQYAQEVDSLKELGMQDDWKLRLLAGGTATVGGLIEGIVPNPFAGSVSLKQGAMKAARQYLWEAIKKAPGELTEEGLQGFTSGLGDYVAQYIASEKDLDFGDGETVKSNGVKKKTIVDAFKKGWEQTKEAALPMAFLLGAPAVGGAGLSAIRARRYQLEQIQAKGFVSESDAKEAGIDGASRRDRMANLEAERQDLDRQEQELVAQSDQEFIQQQQAGGMQVDESGQFVPQVSQADLDREFAQRMASQGGNVSTPAPTDTATVPPQPQARVWKRPLSDNVQVDQQEAALAQTQAQQAGYETSEIGTFEENGVSSIGFSYTPRAVPAQPQSSQPAPVQPQAQPIAPGSPPMASLQALTVPPGQVSPSQSSQPEVGSAAIESTNPFEMSSPQATQPQQPATAQPPVAQPQAPPTAPTVQPQPTPPVAQQTPVVQPTPPETAPLTDKEFAEQKAAEQGPVAPSLKNSWQMSRAEAQELGWGENWSSVIHRSIDQGKDVPASVRDELFAYDKERESKLSRRNEMPKAKVGDAVIRYTHKDGTGLLNNNGLDLSKLTDEEESELVELMDFGLQQPASGTSGVFYFTREGEQKHKRMIDLLSKASKKGVVRSETVLDQEPSWESEDGQIAVAPKQGREQEQEPDQPAPPSDIASAESDMDAAMREEFKRQLGEKDDKQPPKKRPPRKDGKSKKPSSLKKSKGKARKEADNLWDELIKKSQNKLLTGLDPELLTIAAKIAIKELEYSAISFAEFVERSVAKVPDTLLEKLKPYLESAWRTAYDSEMTTDAGGKFDDYIKKPQQPNQEQPEPKKPEPKEQPEAEKESEVDKTLRQAGLNVEKLADGTWQITGNTYEHSKEIGDVKREIRELGGFWDKYGKRWTFKADPRRAIADKLASKGVGKESSDAGVSDEQVARERARREEDAKADVQTTRDAYVASVDQSTRDLIGRGLKFGMTDEVVNNQIEDIGRVVVAAESGLPMFVIGSAPGTGKTFVLGGVIRELRRRGFKKFVYVTQNEDLVSQVQKNLADYGLEGVEFVTYAKARTSPPRTTGSVLLLDEAHTAKNLGRDTGKKLASMVQSSDFTVYATATPFENVTEAEYIGYSGIFDDLKVQFDRPSSKPGGRPFRNELYGFKAWAWMFGANVYFVKQEDRSGEARYVPIVWWDKQQTSEEDQLAANEWLKKRGVYVQRPMALPLGVVNSELRSVEADPYWADISNKVVQIYADAESEAENNVESGQIKAHKANVLKRLLEASKVDAAIARAKDLIGEGKKDDPQVIIFVNTKADTDIGTYTLSEPYRKEYGIKGKEAKRRYTPSEMDEMMQRWYQAKAIAKQMGDDAGPPPFAPFVHKIAMEMDAAGVMEKFPSVIDKIMDAFPGQAVEYSGRTASQNSDNLAEWKNNEAKLIVATMDKGGTGLSFHDTTGKMPSRYQVNMNLPWSGTKVEQVSGRLARYGTAKPVNIEWLFASNIPFDRELSKTVGSRMRSMSAAVQGRKSGDAKRIRDFDFEESPVVDDNVAVAPWSDATVEDEGRWAGTSVNVSAKGKEEGYAGKVVRVLNKGETIEVQRDGFDAAVRVSAERVSVVDLVDSKFVSSAEQADKAAKILADMESNQEKMRKDKKQREGEKLANWIKAFEGSPREVTAAKDLFRKDFEKARENGVSDDRLIEIVEHGQANEMFTEQEAADLKSRIKPAVQQDAASQMHYPDGSAYRQWMSRRHTIGDSPTSYLSGHSSASVREAAKQNPGLGLVITPANPSYVGHAGDYSHIMIDNGAFSEFTGKAPFSEEKFFALLDSVVAAGLKDKVQFVVVPDKVGSWGGTNERWEEFSKRVRAYGMPLAYVGQDGVEQHLDEIPWDEFDVFFIGGSTPWKLGYDPNGDYKDINRPTDDELRKAGVLKGHLDLIKEARRRGKKIHMGRVNSWKRMEIANYGMRVGSADGNYIGAAPDKNLPVVLDWLRGTGGDQFLARHELLLNRAAPYVEKGQSYKRDIADPAMRLQMAIAKGNAIDSSLVQTLTDELEVRLDYWEPILQKTKEEDEARDQEESQVDSGPKEGDGRTPQDQEATRRIVGAKTKVGKRKAHYEVIEIDQLVGSHYPFGMAVNDQFPEEWQKYQRRYESLSDEQKQEVWMPKDGFDPSQVIDATRFHDRGPTMVVEKDGKLYVVGGTRRYMMLANLYRSFEEKAMDYHNALVAEAEMFGLDVAAVNGMDKPILIRVIDEPGDDIPKLVDELNADAGFQKDPAAEAASLGRGVGKNTIAILRGIGDEEALAKFLDRKGVDVVYAMVSDNPELKTKIPNWVKGKSLTKDAKLAVQKAIMGAVISDATLINQASPRILQSVNGALAEILLLNQKGGEWSLSDRIKEAIAYDAAFRVTGKASSGRNIEYWMNDPQMTFFEGFNKDPNSDGYRLWRYLLEFGGARKFRNALHNTMLKEARLDDTSGGLFADLEESMSGNEAFELLIKSGVSSGPIASSTDTDLLMQLDDKITDPPQSLFQSDPDIDADIRSKAMDLGIAANEAGITDFEDFVKYSLERNGEKLTRYMGAYLAMVGKAVGMTGIRPVKDILGVPMTQAEYVQLGKETFASVPAEQVEAGIEAAMLVLPQMAVGFAPAGSPVPGQGLMQGDFDQPSNYEFTESDYRPAVVSYARDKWGGEVASNGKPTWQNFVRWFDDSEVVDKDGKPLVVYHGGARTIDSDVVRTPFFYMTANRSEAEYWAGEGGRVHEVYLKFTKPYRDSEHDDRFMDMEKRAQDYDWDDPEFAEELRDATKQAVDRMNELKSQGYNSIVMQGELNENFDNFIAFDPSQIKSATGNIGDFDLANANMLMQRSVKTDTPAFKKWFGDSKVVDADGNPLVVYHGTGTSVSVMDPRPDVLDDQFGARALDSLEGVFFTDNVDDAANYAKVSPDGPQVMPVYLSIRNPVRIYRPRGTKEIARRLQEAKKAGMDGAVIEHEAYTHYVAFDSTQIKSAIANVGTFDPNNPNMLYQNDVRGIDADSIPKTVLDKMSRRLKSMGYDSRGAEDVRKAIKEKRLLDFQEDWIAAYQFAIGAEQNRQGKAKAKKDLKHVNWSRLSQLGETLNPNEAGYIKPDGSLADFSGKREGGQPGTRSFDHREAGGTAGMQEVIAYGWVRMDENSGSLDIAKMPTPAQLSAITRMAQRKFGEIVLDLEDGLGEWRETDEYYSNPRRRWSQQYPEGTKPQRILNDIKRFFGGDTPNALFQQQAQGGNVKGWTKFISGTRALIGATSKADISTVIHEFAHPIRRFLLDRNVPQDQRLDITDAEIEMLEKKCGAGSVIDGKWVTKWDVPAEEKFAKMWEQYFFEGKSPNTLLDSLFEKISRWMQQVYQSAMSITGGTLDPEVRKLFDKLVQRQLPADQRTDTRSRGGGKDMPPIYLPVTSDQWGDNLTSLANAAANATRERLKLPSLTEPASESFQEWLDAAVVLMRNDPTYANRLVKELQQSSRSIDDVDVAVLNLHYRHLKNLSDAAAKRLFAAIDDKLGDVAIVEARRESDALINEIEDFTDMTKKVGTEAGRALVARKIALAEDYTLGNLLLKARVANAGQPLSESQLQEVRELADKIAKLEGDLAKEIQEKDDLARQLAAKKSIGDTQKQVGKPVRNTATNRAVKKVESFVSKFVNIFGKRDDTTTLQQTEDEQMAEDGEEVIKSFVEAGVYSFGEFMSKFKAVIKGDVPVAARVALRKAWDKMKAQGDIPAPDMSDERQTAELRRLAKMVERNLVEFGITDPEEVIDGVHEALQEVFEDVTQREAMDAMSGYGQYSTPSPEPSDKIIRDLNAQFQQMAKLDDMKQGIAPKKSGRGRDEPSPELRELIREVNEMKRNSKYFVTDPEVQLKTIFQATRTALRNRIYDLDKALNVTKEPIPGRTPNTFEGEQAEEIESLRKQRDELMAAYKATFPKPGLTFEQRAAIAERAIDRAITEIESQLATGDIAPKRRAEPISTPTLEAKRMRLEALRATREAAREMQKPKLTEEEIADREKRRAEKAYVANLLNRIADYEDRKRQGYFGPKPKKEPRDLSPREIELSRQLVNLKDEFFRYAAEYRLKNMSKVERFWDRTKETMHLSRAIMTSFDLSAVFRQGGIASLAHPRLAAAASREMLAALRRGDAEFDTMDKISKDELYALAMRAGLSITTDSGKITRQEEAYMGRWAKWGIGKKGTKINELSLKALFFVAPSARSYTTFLNSMRFRVFKYMVSNLGAGGEVTIDEARVIASYVNAATGRAELGKFNQAAANLNTVFFAPRYVASRFQYLAMPFYLLPSTKVSGRVKKMIAMEYARHAMGLAAFLGLSVALASLLTDDEEEKPTVEFDFRSSDFMKLKIGDTRIDPMAGLSQTVTLIGQMTTGQKKGLRGDIKDLYGENRKFGDPDLWDVGTGFLRKKLAPIPGAIVDLRVGENVIGEKETVLSATTDLFVPLSFQEAGETMKARGLVGGSVVTALSLLGMGGGTYGPKTQYATADATKREELFKKDLENVKWNDPDLAYKDFLTTAQVDKFNKQREGRKQSLVFSAAADPKRKDYNSDETYKKSVEERDKALDAVVKAGMGPKEVQLLLIAYYKRNYGSAYETRGGVYQMKESLANRLRAIRRKLNEQK